MNEYQTAKQTTSGTEAIRQHTIPGACTPSALVVGSCTLSASTSARSSPNAATLKQIQGQN